MNPEKKLSSSQVKKLSSLAKRRLKGEPVAYLLGYKDFFGLRFKVSKHVLIPRPETEQLVDLVIASLLSESRFIGMSRRGRSNLFTRTHLYTEDRHVGKSKLWRAGLPPRDDKIIRVLDVGTGSGCIAISLAKQFSILNFKFSIVGTDISKKALKVAKQNAKAHRVKVAFRHSNILHNVGMLPDVVVANLPYVPEEDYKKLKTNLKYEPKPAIFAKEKGLGLIKRFLLELAQSKILNFQTKIFLEFDPRQKQELRKLIKRHFPTSKPVFYKDLSNRWRFVEISM